MLCIAFLLSADVKGGYLSRYSVPVSVDLQKHFFRIGKEADTMAAE